MFPCGETHANTHRKNETPLRKLLQVLKAHGHLLPSALEAQAEEQRTAEREAAAAAAAEIGARVTVAPAGAVPKHQLELPLSQRLRLSLSQPAVGKLLASAAELAAAGRVLGARAAAQAAAAVAGGTLSDLASLPAETLATALPEGAALDVAQVEAEAAAAEAALASLEDHAGWMVSRDDSLKVSGGRLEAQKRGVPVWRRGCIVPPLPCLPTTPRAHPRAATLLSSYPTAALPAVQVYYRHQKGTSVHGWVAGWRPCRAAAAARRAAERVGGARLPAVGSHLWSCLQRSQQHACLFSSPPPSLPPMQPLLLRCV